MLKPLSGKRGQLSFWMKWGASAIPENGEPAQPVDG